MPPIAALTICTVLVIVLLRIERKRNPEASWALWVPTVWMFIIASRPVGLWFGYNLGQSDEAGSPLDRLVLSTLILIALLILFRRKIKWSLILRDNSWLIILYLFLAFSILWSEFPYVSFKRWIKLSGTIPMALVVLSERMPHKALESVFRRTAYVLLPFSLLLIKYFRHLGIEYHHVTGEQMWIGVSTQKNPFGILCAVSVFFIFWAFIRDRRARGFFKSKSQVFTEALVFGLGVYLLKGSGSSYSATAIGTLIVGIALLLLFNWKKNHVKPMATIIVIAVPLMLLSLYFSSSLGLSLISVLGRDKTLTGRTEIWQVVIDVASRNSLLGAGYGGYWGLKREITSATMGAKEAHSGYLDVYLDVGIIGLVLTFIFLLAYYRKAIRELKHYYDWGVFGICSLIMLLLANYTEGSLLDTSFMWNIPIFLTIGFSATFLRKSLN